MEFIPGGSYYQYRVAKIEAEINCRDPRIHFSESRRQTCIESELKALGLQMKAYTKTEGMGLVIDSLMKE